jgi:hypothetical protein
MYIIARFRLSPASLSTLVSGTFQGGRTALLGMLNGHFFQPQDIDMVQELQ